MVYVQMNSPDTQIEKLEANLRALSARMPDLPFNEILLCRLMLHLGRETAANFEQKIRPFGLAEAEFRVLTTLFSQPEGVAHPSDLCARAAQSPANMSRISDALVSRNLITRVLSVQDRRRMVLRITEEGEELVRRLLPTMFVSLRGLFAEFTASEQDQLISLLKRLHANLEGAHQQEDAHRQNVPERAL
jgi:MarR family transcriptional regulator, negative regulator of the multidrug operon emrRAB